MNLEKYLAKRKQEQLEFNKIPRRHICPSCIRPPAACFCSYIKPFDTNFEFILLMHPKEFKKEPIGTGRYTNKSLKNCRIIVDATFDENRELKEILADKNRQVFLLYPGDSSVNISDFKTFPNNEFLDPNKKPVILIIDGTWACAKSMMRDSHCLHNLPRLSFSTDITSRFHIKLQPADYCLSTIESVHVLLKALEERGLEQVGQKKQILLDTLDRMVRYQVQCANDPNRKGYRRGQFKSKEQRQIPKKWDYRKICFEEKNYY